LELLVVTEWLAAVVVELVTNLLVLVAQEVTELFIREAQVPHTVGQWAVVQAVVLVYYLQGLVV
jgi:hypothetical protein